jgi:hypothetical protein
MTTLSTRPVKSLAKHFKGVNSAKIVKTAKDHRFDAETKRLIFFFNTTRTPL